METVENLLHDLDQQNLKKVCESVGTLSRAIHAHNVKVGWWNELELVKDNPKIYKAFIASKLALIHSEVSEGLEGLRKDLMDDHLPHRKQIEAELVDVLIRTLDLASHLNFDLAAVLVEKINYNIQRPDHKLENRNAENGKAF